MVLVINGYLLHRLQSEGCEVLARFVDARGFTVPMHTKVIADHDFLYSLVSDQTLPPDNDKRYFFLKPKQQSRSSARYSQFSDLLAFNVRGAKGKRDPKQLASLDPLTFAQLLALTPTLLVSSGIRHRALTCS